MKKIKKIKKIISKKLNNSGWGFLAESDHDSEEPQDNLPIGDESFNIDEKEKIYDNGIN